MNESSSSRGFAQTARHAFTRSGFVPPATGEACVLLCDSAAWTAYAGAAGKILDDGERARAARFRFEQDRATYVLAHAMWRMAISVCLDGVDAAQVPLESTPAGQPQLPGTGFSTSLSHSGTWVAIAVCAGTTVGVDIERSPSRMPLEGLMPVICTPAELARLEQLPTLACEAALLALWTRKEALLKAFGVGLGEDPALLPAMLVGSVKPPASNCPDQSWCRVLDIKLPDGLVGALAIPLAIATTRIRRLDQAPDR